MVFGKDRSRQLGQATQSFGSETPSESHGVDPPLSTLNVYRVGRARTGKTHRPSKSES